MHTLPGIPMRSRRKWLTPSSLRMFMFLVFLLLFVNAAFGQTVTTVYSFTGQPAEIPQDVMLAQGRDGQLYGTTADDGIDGSIFKVSTSRIFTQLFSFDDTDGDVPGQGMTLANDGNFYGAASFGGSGDNGVLYEITPSGTYAIIHEFTGGDGTNPFAPPTQASDGSLYGTAESSSAGGATVYKYTPFVGRFQHHLSVRRCGDRRAPLIRAPDGVSSMERPSMEAGSKLRYDLQNVHSWQAPSICPVFLQRGRSHPKLWASAGRLGREPLRNNRRRRSQ